MHSSSGAVPFARTSRVTTTKHRAARDEWVEYSRRYRWGTDHMAFARFGFLAGVALVALFSACDDDDDYDDDICTGDTVVTRADPTADFAQFQTFSVAPDAALPDVPANVATNLAVANAAAVVELMKIGLTQVAADSDPPPDLALFNMAATQKQMGTTWECTPGYWWTGWGYVWDPCAWMVEIPVTYTEGTLVVGLADPAADKVVFGGVLQGVLECSSDTAGRIQSGVARIFQDYPRVN